MAEGKPIRISKLQKEFNVGIGTIVAFLKKKGYEVEEENNPNAKIPAEWYPVLAKEFSSDVSAKKEAEKINLRGLKDLKETITVEEIKPETPEEDETARDILIKDNTGKKPVDIPARPKTESRPAAAPAEEPKSEAKPEAKPATPETATVKPEVITAKPEKVESSAPAQTAEKPAAEKPAAAPVAETVPAEAKPAAEEPAKQAGQAAAIQAETPVQTEAPVQTEKKPAMQAVEEKAPAAEKPVEATETKAEEKAAESPIKVVGHIDLDALNKPAHKPAAETAAKTPEATAQPEAPAAEQPAKAEQPAAEAAPAQHVPEHIPVTTATLAGPKIVGNITLPVDTSKKNGKREREKRKRIKDNKGPNPVRITDTTQGTNPARGERKKDDNKPKEGRSKKRPALHTEVNEEDVQKQIKETLSRLTAKGAKSKSSKYRRDKREAFNIKQQEQEEISMSERNTLKVTEFVSVNELATLMNVPVTNVISTCMSMGLFVSINQRLDAETMVIVADEFGFKVEFISPELHDVIQHEEDTPESLEPRPPIVTVMGHVDHGKTKLLDYIRHTNIIAGEAGGITQHIGAYAVKLKDGRKITFLDTPGHEAFTAMRARGAKITDVAIIVVAADDGVKQQTIEAINHASAAGVPIVFAINKIDKPAANPDKVKEELAQMNYLVEDWGGKYQSQEISAKSGTNVDLLLEKVLLEADILDLKANPNKNATGTVIESSLDKGRGYVATVLVESGTLHQGDIVLAGSFVGSVKAMFNERGTKITEAGPSTPALILGLDGAPQAGDTFNVMDDFHEAREIAVKRAQLQREQGIRTTKHITLDEIGRRIAIGNFQELNIIVKGDVDGSIEAITDSLIKLSTPEIQVNVIHKAVGQISESDILLAAASNAIIVGFQVRPSLNARKLAEKEKIDIRLYSIIYDAIEEIKAAMEGMLSPEIKEEIVATLDIREVFKITKVGTVAGCIVREGKITRNTKVRVIRDGIVIHTGELGSLRRFKDDVKEVTSGYECGLNLVSYNDLQAGDTIEGFQETEVKKKL
ncbi:MAG: translation initiation factor IF-2 [Bacteroidales bacterium]|nr:translation initiation factor IF-2 [Bacteroidales bacterium]